MSGLEDYAFEAKAMIRQRREMKLFLQHERIMGGFKSKNKGVALKRSS